MFAWPVAWFFFSALFPVTGNRQQIEQPPFSRIQAADAGTGERESVPFTLIHSQNGGNPIHVNHAPQSVQSYPAPGTQPVVAPGG